MTSIDINMAAAPPAAVDLVGNKRKVIEQDDDDVDSTVAVVVESKKRRKKVFSKALVKDMLRCTICQDTLKQPVRITQECQHLYCVSCATDHKWNKARLTSVPSTTGDDICRQIRHSVSCPECRKPMTSFSPPDINTLNILNAVQKNDTHKKCPECFKEFQGSYVDFLKHIDSCRVAVPCPDCGYMFYYQPGNEALQTAYRRHITEDCDQVTCLCCWNKSTYKNITECMKIHKQLDELRLYVIQLQNDSRNLAQAGLTTGTDFQHMLNEVTATINDYGRRVNPNDPQPMEDDDDEFD